MKGFHASVVPPFVAILILGLGVLPQIHAAPSGNSQGHGQSSAGWKTYQCNFFEIGIPPNFVLKPEPDRGGGDRGDGVSLWNDRLQVEFYVYSPQWNGHASRTATGPAETLDSHESKRTGDVVEEQWAMTAKDKSYIRFVVSLTNTRLNTNKTFGIRIPDMKIYAQIKPTYVEWKKTLQQFGD